MGAAISPEACLRPQVVSAVDGGDAIVQEHETLHMAMDKIQSPLHLSQGGSNTVIIFDWDDTLLCTTAIRNNECCRSQLDDLALKVESILQTAMGLGQVLIVTNGNGSWVEESAKMYLPMLLPLLSQLKVVSARALYEEAYPGDPVMWKCEAFKHLLKGVEASELNLVALGDQLPEMHAACLIGQLMTSCLVKTVKLNELPSVSELVGQLCRLECELSKIVDIGESAGCRLVCQQGLENGDDSSQASGWKCVSCGEFADFVDAPAFRSAWQFCL